MVKCFCVWQNCSIFVTSRKSKELVRNELGNYTSSVFSIVILIDLQANK